jgi:hypothetical protein
MGVETNIKHFVTLFDSLFLPQGIALYRSLERNVDKFVLWVIAADIEAERALKKLGFKNIKVVPLSCVETVDLLKAKKNRSKVEYYWTLTPFLPWYLLDNESSIDEITYLDADVYFIANPTPIFIEFDASNKSVLITDHGFSPESDSSKEHGQYCVQLMIFKRGSEGVLSWWQARCLEWCYSRVEPGKFGDQKYLDCWPELFLSDVHILSKPEWTLAPWNVKRFPYGGALLFHFHSLRITSSSQVNVGDYSIPENVIKNIYYPYLTDLSYALQKMKKNGLEFKGQANKISLLRIFYIKFIRVVRGIRYMIGRQTLNLNE